MHVYAWVWTVIHQNIWKSEQAPNPSELELQAVLNAWIVPCVWGSELQAAWLSTKMTQRYLSRPPLSFILWNRLSSSNANFYLNYWIPHLQVFFHKPYSFAEFLIHIMNYFLNIVELSAFTWTSFSFITFTLKNSFSITCTSIFFPLRSSTWQLLCSVVT